MGSRNRQETKSACERKIDIVSEGDFGLFRYVIIDSKLKSDEIELSAEKEQNRSDRFFVTSE